MNPWLGVVLFWAGALSGYAVCLVILARRIGAAKERLDFASASYRRAELRVARAFNGAVTELEKQTRDQA